MQHFYTWLQRNEALSESLQNLFFPRRLSIPEGVPEWSTGKPKETEKNGAKEKHFDRKDIIVGWKKKNQTNRGWLERWARKLSEMQEINE